MEQFIVSARKYRPTEFNTVVGQESITKTLQNAIKNNQVAQAFLFCGPRGVGKTTCARILAKALNCKSLTPEGEPCNECDSCLSFDKNASMSIYELDAASNSSVEKMRELVDQVRIPPQGGKYKVYIIDEVHMLSSSAFNAFLKTLEEPPPYAKFILATTEKHKIIPTILSRCQIFDFRRITVEDIAKHLRYVANSENVTADEEALHMIAQKADGGLRDALSIFDQMVSFSGKNLTYHDVIANLNILDYDYFFRIIDFVASNNMKESMLLLEEIIDRGFDPQHFILGLSSHIRNLIMAQTEVTVKLIEVSDQVKLKYINQAKILPTQIFIRMLDIANKCDVQYRESNNKRLIVELALMQMCLLNDSNNNKGNRPEIYDNTNLNKPNQASGMNLNSNYSSDSIPKTISQPKYETSITKDNVKDDFSMKDNKPDNYLSNKSLQGEMISLKSLKEQIKNIPDTSIVSESSLELKKEISEEEVYKLWEETITLVLKDSPYPGLIINFPLKFIPENDVLQVVTGNQLIQQNLLESLQAIQTKFRESLKNRNFKIELIEGEKTDETKEFIYTDEDKLKYFILNNPDIGNFKKQFGLELY